MANGSLLGDFEIMTPDEFGAWMLRHRMSRVRLLDREFEMHPVAFAEDQERAREAAAPKPEAPKPEDPAKPEFVETPDELHARVLMRDRGTR